MTGPDIPSISIAIAPLTQIAPGHWATWVVQAPYPGGYVHHDRPWPDRLSLIWQAWQNLFSSQPPPGRMPEPLTDLPSTEAGSSYSSRLMQHLGIQLWQWLMEGSIQSSFSQSQGMAMGQEKPLRLRLELRDPELAMLPWELMQSQAGRQAISLSQQILFSRTTSDVDPLMPPRLDQGLTVLLVLGLAGDGDLPSLQLDQEVALLTESLKGSHNWEAAPCQVDVLVQPEPRELVAKLEQSRYNVFFYAGHGITAPDGGQLLLGPDRSLSGTELAQVLTRCQVALAVFNACWGAQPDLEITDGQQRAVPRSSLAEVLIHHGVPAVVAMRDTIADDEALSFVQTFMQALSDRLPIDQAVAVARQQLLTLYHFNQPAWTLPVLYMHPEFDGELIRPIEGRTQLPTTGPGTQIHGSRSMLAQLRSIQDPLKIWTVQGNLMRVGRRPENDVVIHEQWVSQQHAEIICRVESGSNVVLFFLRDFSRFGTLMVNGRLEDQSTWQRVHHQEMPLESGTKLRFGSSQGQTLEFVVQRLDDNETYL
jgi:hypothetical protein